MLIEWNYPLNELLVNYYYYILNTQYVLILDSYEKADFTLRLVTQMTGIIPGTEKGTFSSKEATTILLIYFALHSVERKVI